MLADFAHRAKPHGRAWFAATIAPLALLSLPVLADQSTWAIVTYLEVSPAAAPDLAATLNREARRVAREAGALETSVLREVGRPERFAAIETWATQAALTVHRTSGVHLAGDAPLLAPLDERIVEPLAVNESSPISADALFVLIHVDVVPTNLAEVNAGLIEQAAAARTSAGNLRYEVWRQPDRPNHFTVIEAWTSRAAYDQEMQSARMKALRAKIQSAAGALYDERLYRRAATQSRRIG